MKMQRIFLVLAAMLAGCGYLRSLFAHRVPVEDDRSIAFPRFFESVPTEVGARDEPYELDGEALRALVIASNDYIPPSAGGLPCHDRQEAQLYRLIRQGDIIFVYIYENHAYCGHPYPVRHSGAKYAISTDGRILRRLIGDQPEDPIERETPDAGGRWIRAEPGVSSEFDAIWNAPLDGGAAPASTDGGTSMTNQVSSGGETE
jgi:hypothetical protein